MSFAPQHAFEIVRDPRLVAGRTLSVNSYKVNKKMYRLGLGLIGIQGGVFGLGQAKGCGREHAASHEHCEDHLSNQTAPPGERL